MTIYPGNPFPLGATLYEDGVNFALFSENAEGVDLCFFNEENEVTEVTIKMKERSHYVWHAFVPGIKAGQQYGYRVHGPFSPEKGHRFNANKLLLDPYAKAIAGTIQWHDALFGYEIGHPKEDRSFSKIDSAPYMPKSVVIDEKFDWEDDKKPNTPYHKTIIYEAHVKGLTKLHPAIPENIRGTYAAIGHPVIIDYLHQLGITAIELMPVHHFIRDRHLAGTDLQNYWGYNTLGFFAPDVRYSSSGIYGEQVTEFKQMVKALHKAGIEVILDVVYNHTGEGSHMGPTISFRGVDNAAYYRLTDDKRYYMDYTGTGNTLNAMQPNVLRLIMDSLRFWIVEMHVDGFRFDLASALARELHEVDKLGSFFDIIHQDPIISQAKLIAEPWDIGEGGYQVGKFPPGWAEWNGKYRDCIRDYWRGADSKLGEFALRFTGSPDLYENDNRHPTASINFITAHDGFTMHDLVSYNEKHNYANSENNNDGETHNSSWNCGIEGYTEDSKVNELRKKQKRNFLTTLFLSQGVPMLTAGDEISRTQRGNNNAYCQDNEISWVNWEEADTELLDFTRKLIHFCHKHPTFNRRGWFTGQQVIGVDLEDISWFLPNGHQMTAENWNHDFAKSLGVYLNGNGIHYDGPQGEKIVDDTFYVLFNAHFDTMKFKLPKNHYGNEWTKVIDTATNLMDGEEGNFSANKNVMIASRSLVVLKQIS